MIEDEFLQFRHAPKSVGTDGWEATWKAWWALFPTTTVLLCFLHSTIKIRDCRASDKGLRFDALTKAWEAFHAKTKASFSQRIRRLREWASANLPGGSRLREAVLKLYDKREYFALTSSLPIGPPMSWIG